MNVEWLKVYAKDDRGPTSPLAGPIVVDMFGGPWTIATDGHIAVALEGKHAPPREVGQRETLVATFANAPAMVPVDLAALRAFIGPVQTLPPPSECVVCKGEGETTCKECHGGGTCTCHCGDDHDCGECEGSGAIPCKKCDNHGRVTELPARPVLINGHGFNANLLTHALANLPGDTAEIGLKTDPPDLSRANAEKLGMLWLHGPGWRVVVMGYRIHSKEAAAVPRFTVGGEQSVSA
jgi:hypothetical protein